MFPWNLSLSLVAQKWTLGWPRRATPTKISALLSSRPVIVGVALRGHPRAQIHLPCCASQVVDFLNQAIEGGDTQHDHQKSLHGTVADLKCRVYHQSVMQVTFVHRRRRN